MKKTVYLGLGCNLGQRRASLSQAKILLNQAPGLQIEGQSALYETAPWGLEGQPSFYNAALKARCSLQPLALLDLCKSIEAEMGRKPGQRWGPRLIDIDILLYGEDIWELPRLKIPHIHLHQRAFALIPLLELAPGIIIPGKGRGQKHLENLPHQGIAPVAAAGDW